MDSKDYSKIFVRTPVLLTRIFFCFALFENLQEQDFFAWIHFYNNLKLLPKLFIFKVYYIVSYFQKF